MSYLIILAFLLTPTYTIRFNLFGFPTNILMVWVFFVWLTTIIYLSTKKQWQEFFDYIRNLDKKLLVLIVLFLLAGLVSLSVKGFDLKKLGQFIVLFLQPISLFFIAGFTFRKNSEKKYLLLVTCYLLLTAMGVYAIIQYFTLFGLPPAYWGNSGEPKRALGFFSHPNFYALFSAPLLAFLIPDLFASLKLKNYNLKAILWLLGATGLLFSMSRAGWLGLVLALVIYILVPADKKIKKIVVALGIIVLLAVISIPNLRWRIILPFYGEKSAVSRISLGQTGIKAVKESPVLGLGLTGFAKNWDRLNIDPNIDHHNFPHNVFLNFWVETGSLGLISFIGLIGLLIYRGFKKYSPPQDMGRGGGGVDIFRLGVSLFLIALITQGLIDNPYLKNDLAMAFWIILCLGI